MKVKGTHQGKAVEVEYTEEMARKLMDGAAAVAQTSKSTRIAAKFAAEASEWQRVIVNPEIINSEEYAALRQAYINDALFDEARFDAMFQ